MEQYGSNPIEDHIGTGPYEFVAWLPDRHVEVNRFDGYQPVDQPSDGYAGERTAYLDTIRFAVVTETATRIAGVQTGEYDYGWQITRNAENVRVTSGSPRSTLTTSPFRRSAQGPESAGPQRPFRPGD